MQRGKTAGDAVEAGSGLADPLSPASPCSVHPDWASFSWRTGPSVLPAAARPTPPSHPASPGPRAEAREGQPMMQGTSQLCREAPPLPFLLTGPYIKRKVSGGGVQSGQAPRLASSRACRSDIKDSTREEARPGSEAVEGQASRAGFQEGEGRGALAERPEVGPQRLAVFPHQGKGQGRWRGCAGTQEGNSKSPHQWLPLATPALRLRHNLPQELWDWRDWSFPRGQGSHQSGRPAEEVWRRVWPSGFTQRRRTPCWRPAGAEACCARGRGQVSDDAPGLQAQAIGQASQHSLCRLITGLLLTHVLTQCCCCCCGVHTVARVWPRCPTAGFN